MMPDPKNNPLVKSVEALATQKEEVATRVEELVQSLNAVLRRMGYQVVPVTGGAGTGKRRGRPPGSGRGRKTKRGPGRPPKNGRRKRRGRPKTK
jgi:hypothetical protein